MGNANVSNVTIRPEEADFFAKLARDWWNPKGPMASLHQVNPVRLAFVRDAIDAHWPEARAALKPLAGKSALDIGCGAGLLCEPLARLGAAVTGVDAAAENIAAASAHAEGMGLDIRYMAGEVAGLDIGTFDLVTSVEVIEHVADKPASCRGWSGGHRHARDRVATRQGPAPVGRHVAELHPERAAGLAPFATIRHVSRETARLPVKRGNKSGAGWGLHRVWRGSERGEAGGRVPRPRSLFRPGDSAGQVFLAASDEIHGASRIVGKHACDAGRAQHCHQRAIAALAPGVGSCSQYYGQEFVLGPHRPRPSGVSTIPICAPTASAYFATSARPVGVTISA